MVACGTQDTQKDLHRVSRDAAATAVVLRAAEPLLVLAIPVKVHIRILLQAGMMIVFCAVSNDTLLNVVWSELLIIVSEFTLSAHFLSLLLLDLHHLIVNDISILLADEARCLVGVALYAEELG